MQKFLLLFSVMLVILSCQSNKINRVAQLHLDEFYPRWIVDDGYHTNQTSGISYLDSNEKDEKFFLLADDIGKIHLLKISDDTTFTLTNIELGENVQQMFHDFPKLDFEEITYDKYTGAVYLSIEGNTESYEDYVGIYKLSFDNNNIFDGLIVDAEKLNILPEEEFLKYTRWNVGYEGMAVDSNYLYLGLEGFVNDKQFADSTLILVVDKKQLNIVKQISTKQIGIHTIGGLYVQNNLNLWAVDRNNKTLYMLKLNDELNITNSKSWLLNPTIPGYSQFNYNASIESVTIDDEGNIYLVDDPWQKFFIPPEEILKQLDNKTISNFTNYIPVIFRYTIISN